jgi:hypothetical protein
MRFRSTWTRSLSILIPLLLAGCRITEDMPLGQKIVLGTLYGVMIVAGVFVFMVAAFASPSA